ncbi:MAG: hypothetical protein U0X39_01810 [Bacteroidales bacterium]
MNKGGMPGMNMRQGPQKLAASGFIIKPTRLSVLVQQTGTGRTRRLTCRLRHQAR